jgi:Family of unknown function (DUF5719)
MSDRELTLRLGRRTLGRRAVTLVGAATALVLIGAGGSLLGAESATTEPARPTTVGRTTTVCTVGTKEGSRSLIAAVAIRREVDRQGEVRAEQLSGDDGSVAITEQGKGKTLAHDSGALLLHAEEAMATGTSAVVLRAADSGEDAGLLAAPCLPPTTMHWFPGIGSSGSEKTELILTNPDDSQAEVDLRFFGERGRVPVPGSPNIAVDGRTSRTITLSSLVQTDGPLSVAVRATSGRVAAVAHKVRSNRLAPAGADWQVGSAAPATTTVIPAVPDGEGRRRLVVSNPGTVRATVSVSVLGLQGEYAPSGAEGVDLAPESSAELNLTAGLAGEPGAIKLTSDQPVTGTVISTGRRAPAQEDLAISTASAPLVRDGVSAIATVAETDSDLILTNGTEVDTPVTFEVFSYAGVSLRTDDVLLAGNSTATRRLNTSSPSYVVVRVPTGSGIYGGLRLEQPDGDVAGLTVIPLTSPDVASRAPAVVPDTAVGR